MRILSTYTPHFFALKLLWFLQFLLVFFTSVKGQNSSTPHRNLIFTHFTSESGLGDNSIKTGLLDQQGYLWIATLNGLSRFDGHSFRTYESEPADTTTLGGIAIMDMVENRDGKIWVAVLGGTGLNCFDPVTETFRRFYFLLLDAENQLWIAGQGLWKYDSVVGECKPMFENTFISFTKINFKY